MAFSRKKISLIGGGNIGGTIAQLASRLDVADIVLYDINGNMAKGKALDIMQMNALLGVDVRITGSGNIADIAGSDAIIVTAGVPRRPGGTREDLITTNAGVISAVASDVKKYSPDAFVVVVTNPLDAMVSLFQEVSGLSRNMVAGMAGMLDTARLKFFLAEEFGVSSTDIGAVVLGGHGDSMVPIISSSTVMGVRIMDLVRLGLSSKEKIDQIVARTRVGGGEIVSLLGFGSAFYAPALAALQMILPYLSGSARMITASVFLDGEYGVNGLYVGAPAVIGASGVERILEIDLTPEERKMFADSVSLIQQTVDFSRELLRS